MNARQRLAFDSEIARSRELVVAHAEDGTLDAFEMIYEKVQSMREVSV